VFDLPTEAQWEYACRAGTTGTYGDSDTVATTSTEQANRLFPLAWFDANNSPAGVKEVGVKKANRAGLYDMHGNAWEWCRDAWDGSASLPGGINPRSGSGNNFVLRSGHANTAPRLCRSASRYSCPKTYTDESIGFRLIAITP
ncbi:MAG: formylglycine-generating enzyme family protein, partial [Verrucomicrobiota bacterium]|jgi:formylglycine-generating enzyme required for sulfatase activity|nr:formylglycine-generating enzyme family protein [Verrucomicrobiota bacterium]